MDLENEIKKIMLEKSISNYKLSKATGIDTSQLSKFFHKKINLSFNNILLILDFLGYEINLTKNVDNSK